MSGGYAGKILRVDLSAGTTKDEHFARNTLRDYIGGSGLGARVLFDETGPETDPLGPDNLLIFMTGPFTGTIVPTSGRHAVVAKSPLTGIWGESDVGGRWGAALKRAGYDGLVIRGKAAHPVYIVIGEGKAEIRDARHVWGQDTFATDGMLRRETSSRAAVACIGPAGERMVRLASIMTDGPHARAAGRGGLGAVMGAKNLKAVVAYGSTAPRVAEPERLMASVREMTPVILKGTERLQKFGTAGIVVSTEAVGDLPIKNWYQGRWEEGAAKISGERMAETVLTGRFFCDACFIGCGREVKISAGRYAPVEGAGPEYETLGMLGSNCLVDELEAICRAADMCNRYGLDTISTGAVIGFAMEAFEKGLLGPDLTGGREVRWGDPAVLLWLVELIGRREGLGELLGLGVREAAARLGQGAESFAIHVKGLELPAHDPRAYASLAVDYATTNRGACHLQGFSYAFEKAVTMPEFGYDKVFDRFAVEGKGELAARAQNLMSLMDSLKLCKFVLYGGVKVSKMVEWLNLVTGLDYSVDEFLTVGERVYNLKRLYNVGCGISRRDDVLPERILKHKRGEGGAADYLPDLERMLGDYYRARDWDENGVPRREKLASLGL